MSNTIRIVAWNCRRAARVSAAWDYLLELDPDIALLQEVGQIGDRVASTYSVASATPTTRSGRPQRFQTAVLVKGTITADISLPAQTDWVARELEFFRGNFVAQQVKLLNGLELKVISVYSPAFPIARSRLADVDTAGIQLIHNRDVWATEILWSWRTITWLSEVPSTPLRHSTSSGEMARAATWRSLSG